MVCTWLFFLDKLVVVGVELDAEEASFTVVRWTSSKIEGDYNIGGGIGVVLCSSETTSRLVTMEPSYKEKRRKFLDFEIIHFLLTFSWLFFLVQKKSWCQIKTKFWIAVLILLYLEQFLRCIIHCFSSLRHAEFLY